MEDFKELAVAPEARIANQSLNVRDFGAIGDGTTDDTNALLSVLTIATQLSQTNASNTTKIYVPSGIYRITQPITITTSGISIIGEGKESTIFRQDTWGYPVFEVRANACSISDLGAYSSIHTIDTVDNLSPGNNTLTLPVSAASLNISVGSYVYIGSGFTGESCYVTAVSGNTITCNTAKSHSAPFPITVQSIITGTYDGAAARGRAALVYCVNASNCSFKRLNVYGMPVGVYLRGNTGGNTINDYNNIVDDSYHQGVSFGTLVQQQTGASITKQKGTNYQEFEGTNPPHQVYFTGQFTSATAQRNINCHLSDCICNNILTGAAWAIKFCDRLTCSNMVSDACERGAEIEGCINSTFSNFTITNVPNISSVGNAVANYINTDSQQGGMVVTDCQYCVFSNCLVNLLNYNALTSFTDNTDNTSNPSTSAQTLNFAYTSGQILAGSACLIDSGASSEIVSVSSVGSNSMTAIFNKPHSAPFTIKVFPPSDGVSAFAVRSYNTQNAGGIGSFQNKFINCTAITAYSASNTTSAYRIEGSQIEFSDCSLVQYGDTGSGGTWYAFKISQGGSSSSITDLSSLNGNAANPVMYSSGGSYTFTSANVGSYLQAVSGTNFNATFTTYQIIAFSLQTVNGVPNTPTVTLNRTIGTAATLSGGTATITTAPHFPDANIIKEPRIWGCQSVVLNSSGCTNSLIDINNNMIFPIAGVTASIGNNTSKLVTNSGNGHIIYRDNPSASLASASFPTLSGTTPTVMGSSVWRTNSNGNITSFGFGTNGMTIVILGNDAGATVLNPSLVTNIKLSDIWVSAQDATITFKYNGTNWDEISRSMGNGIATLSASTTPSVANGKLFYTNSNGAITSFTNGITGQIITIIGNDAGATTIAAAQAAIHLTAAWTSTTTNTLVLVYNGTKWVEISRGS